MDLNSENILDFIPEPALIVDQHAHVIFANELFLSQYGIKRRLFQGGNLHLDQLIKFELIGDIRQCDDSYQETGFSIVPTDIRGSCLLGVRKHQDQYIIVLKDNSVEVELHAKYQKQLDELSEYSKNLEEKVRQRTKDLSNANQFISGMLNSLGQAILVLDENGKCLPYHTSNCSIIFKSDPEGKSFWEIISAPEEDVPFLQRWITHLIKEKINFEDIAELGPQTITLEDTHIELKYFPLRSEQLIAEGIVVVARDITRLIELEKDLQSTTEFEKILTKVATNLFIYRSALEEQKIAFKTLLNSQKVEIEVFRKTLHQLKGSFSLFSMHALEKMTHQAEDIQGEDLSLWMRAFTDISEAAQLLHTRLAKSLGLPPSGGHIWVDREKIIKLAVQIGHPHKDVLISLATIKLKDYLSSYTFFTKELCNQLNKKLDQFIINGPDIPTTSKLTQALQPIVTLYLRNVVDHGFWEDESEKKNNININFELINNRLQFEIIDSGRGSLAKKNHEPNLISGRGLGMKIIEDLLLKLNGSLAQTFTKEGCILKMEMDWPSEDN